MGYSIPGAVISIGMLLFFISLDGKLVPLYNLVGIDNSLFLTLSFALLVSAYLVRFLAISYNTIESGFEKVGLKFHEASRTLGKGISKTFLLVDLRKNW
jgi:iron(III) transport system permease protein